MLIDLYTNTFSEMYQKTVVAFKKKASELKKYGVFANLWSKVVECGEKYVTLKPNNPIYYVRMRFLGNIEAKVDAKGRIFFPSTFRKLLQTCGEESLVLRKDVFQPCLVLYPQSVWNKQMDELRAKLNRWNKEHQRIFRQFVSDAESITLDGNGRFLIPKRYLDMASITQGVKFIGMGDSIEIWSNANTEKPFMEPEEFGAALEGIMGNFTQATENTEF